MARTACCSPCETRAEAISMRLTCSSSSNSRAMESFSRALKETPEVCSPSRSVVSMISTGGKHRRGLFAGGFEGLGSGRRCCTGNPRRRSRFRDSVSCRRRSRSARCGPWLRRSASCPSRSTVKRAAGSSSMAAKIAARKSSLTGSAADRYSGRCCGRCRRRSSTPPRGSRSRRSPRRRVRANFRSRSCARRRGFCPS